MKFNRFLIILSALFFAQAIPSCNKNQEEEKKPPVIPDRSKDKETNCTNAYSLIENAIPVPAQDNYSHSAYICKDGSVLYKLVVKEKTLFNFSLTFSESADLDLILYNENEEDINNSYYYNPEEMENTLMPGTYYIEVYGYKASTRQGSQYTLNIKATPTCASDDDCDPDEYCNFFAGDICQKHCQTNDDCIYQELSCVQATGQCVWGQCLSDDDCSIFGTNAPYCVVTGNMSSFVLDRICSNVKTKEHCVTDNDLLETVSNTTVNNDDLVNPYEIKLAPGKSFSADNLKTCSSDSGDYYKIILDGSSDDIVDLSLTIYGSDSIYFTGALYDYLSGRLLDGGSFNVIDWDSCKKRFEPDLNGTCDLAINFKADKIDANTQLLLAVTRYPLTLTYYGNEELNADPADIKNDVAVSYKLQIDSTLTDACQNDLECSKIAYPRVKCQNGCRIDNSIKSYSSQLNGICLDYLDCDIRNNFDYYCSRTQSNSSKNFCTMECNTAADCANIHGGKAADYICSEQLCHKAECVTADDCPYKDIYHQYCHNGRCVECTQDSECVNDNNYDKCESQYNTCSMCYNNNDCATSNEGSICILVDDDDPYHLCGCTSDDNCSDKIGQRCLTYPQRDFGICGCNDNDDCAEGYSCLKLTNKCYKSSK